MTENPTEHDAKPTAEADACSPPIESELDQRGPVPRGGPKARRGLRPRINFYLDVSIAVVLAALLGTGVLLEWVLPPGMRGGRGLTWLGEHRHYWGDVHFWLAVSTISLVLVHLALHATWIAQCWKRSLGSLRSPVTWGIIAVALGAIVLPLTIPAERGSHRGHRGGDRLEALQRVERRGRGRFFFSDDAPGFDRRGERFGRGRRGGLRGRSVR
jgi:hypothetical protein